MPKEEDAPLFVVVCSPFIHIIPNSSVVPFFNCGTVGSLSRMERERAICALPRSMTDIVIVNRRFAR
jgi:hypothetical protein